jgi:NADPH-dependent curcumin reductase CurA
MNSEKARVITTGLENAPVAFIGLLQGCNFGKLVVRVAKV